MSLRWFHLVFLLIVMIGADLFGAWAVWNHAGGGNPLILGMGCVSLAGGLGLAAYVAWLVRKLDRAHVA
jgi:hypothetical protein